MCIVSDTFSIRCGVFSNFCAVNETVHRIVTARNAYRNGFIGWNHSLEEVAKWVSSGHLPEPHLIKGLRGSRGKVKGYFLVGLTTANCQLVVERGISMTCRPGTARRRAQLSRWGGLLGASCVQKPRYVIWRFPRMIKFRCPANLLLQECSWLSILSKV